MPSKKVKKLPIPAAFDSTILKQIGTDLAAYDLLLKDDEKRKTKDEFMDLYQKCEYAYKALLSDYKQKVMGKTPNPALSRETDLEFNPNNQKIISSQFPKVFAYALLKVDDMLFSSDSIYETVGSRSCRKLRDAITHGSSKKAINEVFDRKAVLFKVMNDFLKCFK